MAQKLYGNSRELPKNQHQKNVKNVLKILALNGPLTTWEMAQIRFPNDHDKVRTKEKEYRRILIGRKDHGKRSEGIFHLKLITLDSVSHKRNPGNRYRLSVLGVLFCLDTLNLSNKEIDIMAKAYSKFLPKVFGKWNFLKSQLGDIVYDFKLLGKGLLFDNPNIIKIKNPNFYELISFLNIKSQGYSESLTESDLSEIISYWFFISLLYLPFLKSLSSEKYSTKFLQKILKKDKILNNWFSSFLNEAKAYSEKRYIMINKLKI